MTNRIPVIIDTDMGVDDAYSVMLALSSSKLNVLGITTSYGNVTAEAATLNAIKILELLEKRVRVAKGASGPPAWRAWTRCPASCGISPPPNRWRPR